MKLRTKNLLICRRSISREVSHTVSSRNTLWQSSTSVGSLNQTLHMTSIQVPVGLTNFVGSGGISVQLPKGAALTTQIAALAKQPGNEYLTDLAKRSDIDWKQVEVINKSWDYKKQGLTQEAAIIVAIVVTIVTLGWAAEAGAGLAVAAGEGTAAVAATATTAAVAGTVTTTGAVIAGATSAAITTLATQAAIALINNQGDVGAAAKELGSKENVKALAVAVVTAGLVQGLGQAITFPVGDGVKTLAEITQKGGSATFLQNLSANLINGVAGSLVSTAINGGSLEDALKNAVKNAVIASVAAQGAGVIGDLKTGENPSLNMFSGTLAHAMLGCAMGSATVGNSSGCAAGAGGAVVGELSAEWYGSTFGGNPGSTPADAANFAKLTTAIAGLAGGANAMTIAGITSSNAVVNNYLNHTQWKQLKEGLDACKLTKSDCTDVITAFRKLNNVNDDALALACKDPNSAGCTALVNEAAAAKNDQFLLGIDNKYLGSGSQDRSNLIIGKVQGARNVEIAQANCVANPEACVTTPQGIRQVGIGSIKGIGNAPIDLVNTAVAVINGYSYIVDAVTGQPIVQLITPIPYPTATQPNGTLQEVGNVIGSTAATGLVLGGAGAALEGGTLNASKSINTARSFYESTGWSETRIASHLGGIDFAQPVEFVVLPKGTQVVQYQIPGNPTGNYFASVGTPAEAIGVDPIGRTATTYTVTSDIVVLRSKAADTTANMSLPLLARGKGGGVQFFTPDVKAFTMQP